MVTDWTKARGPLGLVGAFALISGGMLPGLPLQAQAAVLLAAALLVITLIIRPWRVGRSQEEPASLESATPIGDTAAYRLSKWLTYLGFGTLALLTVRPTSTVALSDWIFLGALAIALLGYATRSRSLRPPPNVLMLSGVGLLLAGAVLSLGNAVDPTESLATVGRFVYITVGWFALGPYALRTLREISTATQIWVVSVGLSGAAAVAQLLGGPLLPGTVAATGRMVGFAVNPNDLGGMCAVALIPALSLIDGGHGVMHRLMTVAIVASVITGLILSGSLDGLLASGVGFGLWIWTGSAGRRGVGTLVGIAALLVVLAGTATQLGLMLPGTRIASAFSNPNDPNASFYLRLQSFDEAWRSITSNSVFGAGFDPMSAATSGSSGVHNLLLATWYEGGTFALVGIVLILLAGLRLAWCAWARSTSRESRRLAGALLAAVGSAVAFSMGNPILLQRYIWAPVFLVIALISQQARARRFVIDAGPFHGGAVGARPATRGAS